MSLLNKETVCTLTHSRTAQALRNMGISDIAAELAIQNLPLAGRLSHFLSNWEAITQDEWVLQTITGYRIEFLRKPEQNHRPPQITFQEREEECMLSEI